MWYALVMQRVGSLKELMDLMHDINGISHDWGVWSDMVTFGRGDAILICRYSGSTCYEAGRTEMARMLEEREWRNVRIDDPASRAVNKLDGAMP